MAQICFYFQVHQPYRLRRYSVFDTDHHYFDAGRNGEILRKVAEKCYLPAGQALLKAITDCRGAFSVAFSLSGVAIEQMQEYCPEALTVFKELAATGRVEFLSETYHHSLAFLYSREEFRQQIELHRTLIQNQFGQTPRVFRNTELIYNNDLGHLLQHLGFDAVLTEGVDSVLGTRTSADIYHPPNAPALRLLLKNYKLSDDIAFRFTKPASGAAHLTVDDFLATINGLSTPARREHPPFIGLFMDYETFGEHHWAETGVLDFLAELPAAAIAAGHQFVTPGAVAAATPIGPLDVPQPISWADTERDISAWLGNAMQNNALQELYRLEGAVRQKNDPQLLTDWRRLTTSDHFYYMSTKHFADGDVHRYFSPYESPYDSYINFMNVMDNLQSRTR